MIFPRSRITRIIRPCLMVSVLTVAVGQVVTVQANGFDENRSWQFKTANDRIADVNTLDLIERKKGGYYDSFDVNNTYTTNFAGDQINCYQSASTTGNSGSNQMDAVTSSPTTGTQGAGMDAVTVGNDATTDVDGSNPPGSSDSTSNVSSTNANQYADVGQSNSNSTQSSELSDSSISSSVGSVDTRGGLTDQALNSSQRNQDSTLTASISGSTGCTFTDGGSAGARSQAGSSVNNSGNTGNNSGNSTAN